MSWLGSAFDSAIPTNFKQAAITGMSPADGLKNFKEAEKKRKALLVPETIKAPDQLAPVDSAALAPSKTTLGQ